MFTCPSAHLSIFSFCLSAFLYIYLSCISVRQPVCLSIYLSVWPSSYTSICLSVCLSTCVYFYLSICLSVYLSICLSVYLSICLPVYLYDHLRILQCVYRSVCSPVYTSICLYVYLSILLSVYLYICLCVYQCILLSVYLFVGLCVCLCGILLYEWDKEEAEAIRNKYISLVSVQNFLPMQPIIACDKGVPRKKKILKPEKPKIFFSNFHISVELVFAGGNSIVLRHCFHNFCISVWTPRRSAWRHSA